MKARAWVLLAGAVGVAALVLWWVWAVVFAVEPAVLRDGETRASSAGEVVWSDDRRYLLSAHPVGVVWQEGADVLWLLSGDIGTSRVVEKDGKWVKEWDWDTLPPDIKKIKDH